MTFFWLWLKKRWHISSRLSRNSEASTSEFLETLEEKSYRYFMHWDVCSILSSSINLVWSNRLLRRSGGSTSTNKIVTLQTLLHQDDGPIFSPRDWTHPKEVHLISVPESIHHCIGASGDRKHDLPTWKSGALIKDPVRLPSRNLLDFFHDRGLNGRTSRPDTSS